MKIIHVAGFSGTGKTTFIRGLVKELNKIGTTAVVKHMGHHLWELEENKDTTVFFESGACVSAGIDDEKSVLVTDDSSLDTILEIFSNRGIQYAIVEGFKSKPYTKICMGDASGLENVLCMNPELSDVLDRLPEFDDFYTIEGLVRELKASCDMTEAGAILTFNGIVRERSGEEITEYLDFFEDFDRLIEDIRQEMESVDGILGVRFHHRKGRLYAGEDITYIALVARRRREAFFALSRAIDRMKKELHDWGKDLAGA